MSTIEIPFINIITIIIFFFLSFSAPQHTSQQHLQDNEGLDR